MQTLKTQTISEVPANAADIEPAKMDLKYILTAGLVIVVTGIVLSFGAQVQGEVAEDFSANTYEKNISNKALEGNYNLTKKLPTIGTVVAIVVVIGLLIGGFAYLMR